MPIELHRPGRDEDIDALCGIWDECFPVGRNYFLTSMNILPGREWQDTRILEIDGRIASLLNLYRMPVRFGCAVLPMGGVGDVATPVAYQRRGYSTRVLLEAQEYLVGRGCSISFLYSGLVALYGKAGWTPTPVAGVECHRWDAPAGDVEIRPAALADLCVMQDIYREWACGQVGMVERDTEYWRLRLFSEAYRLEVAERDREIVAYAIADADPDRHGGFREIACRPGEEAAAGALIQRLAAEYRPTRPPKGGEFLLDRLARQEPVEGGRELMAMVLDWKLFAEQMAPEWRARLVEAPGRCALAVENPQRPGGLVIDGRRVAALGAETPDFTLTSEQFWQLFTGRKRIEEIRPESTEEQRNVINATFPRVKFNFSNADFF